MFTIQFWNREKKEKQEKTEKKTLADRYLGLEKVIYTEPIYLSIDDGELSYKLRICPDIDFKA